jgi:hypothetical protein
MAQPKIVADFETSLAAKIAVGGTTGTLVSNTDDDGVALATGIYYFTIDGNNSSKEHIKCTNTAGALTNVYSVSRQGVETSGTVREHRVGAKVVMTDFATYKTYIDELTLAGAAEASTSAKGIVEEATSAEIDAGTDVGSTGARLYINPNRMFNSTYGGNMPSTDQKAALAGTSGTPSVSNKYVTADGLAAGLSGLFTIDSGYTPGDTVLFSNNAEKLFTNNSYTKQKEIRIDSPVRLLRVYWRFYVAGGSNGVTKVYLNGVAVSSEVAGTSATWVVGTHDLSAQLNTGDLVQIYGYRSVGGGTMAIDNFRLTGEYANKRIYAIDGVELTSSLEVELMSNTNTVDATNTLT